MPRSHPAPIWIFATAMIGTVALAGCGSDAKSASTDPPGSSTASAESNAGPTSSTTLPTVGTVPPNNPNPKKPSGGAHGYTPTGWPAGLEVPADFAISDGHEIEDPDGTKATVYPVAHRQITANEMDAEWIGVWAATELDDYKPQPGGGFAATYDGKVVTIQLLGDDWASAEITFYE